MLLHEPMVGVSSLAREVSGQSRLSPVPGALVVPLFAALGEANDTLQRLQKPAEGVVSLPQVLDWMQLMHTADCCPAMLQASF